MGCILKQPEQLPEEHPAEPSEERSGERPQERQQEFSEERLDNMASAMRTYYNILSKDTEPLELAEIAKPLQTLLRPGDTV